MNFTLNTTKKQELIDITQKINDVVKKSKIKQGVCHVFVKHTTAALIINENDDPHVCTDFLHALNKVFPDKAGYIHDRIDNNAGAHIKASVLGSSIAVPVENSRLRLGRWQAIMLVELDGPRCEREIEVKIVKEV